jgi:hypothetical protein
VVTLYFRKSFLCCFSILVDKKHLAYLLFKLAFLLFCSGVLKRVAADGPVLGNVGRTPAFQPQTIAQLKADTVLVDKRQRSHTSQSMA